MKLLPHVVVHWEGRLPAVLLLGDRIAWAKGTSFRQDGIRAGLGRRRALARWYAWLVREPGNPHDPNAIAIYLAQTHVGYVVLPQGRRAPHRPGWPRGVRRLPGHAREAGLPR